MLGQILYDGFSSANRRVGIVFLDVLWKAVWLFATGVFLGLFLMLAAAELQSISWEVSEAPQNPLLAAVVLRELWETYSAQAAAGLLVIAAASMIAWLIMEPYFRSRLLPTGEVPRTGSGPATSASRPRSPSTFSIFLASGIARTLILCAATLVVAVLSFGHYLATPFGEWPSLWSETRGVAVVGVSIIVGLAFLVTVADTLIRSNTIQLLGSHMLEVAGLIGTLLFIETCIAVSGMLIVVAGVLQISSPLEFFMAMTMVAAAAFLMSTLHSYLLLVRFLSIDIMRRDVIDV
jgi:hypothetical protein